MADLRLSGMAGIPKGTTSDRPSSPSTGDVFYNGTLEILEIYNGAEWVANSAPPATPTIATPIDASSTDAYTSTAGKISVVFTKGSGGGSPTQYNAFTTSGGFSANSNTTTVNLSGLTPGTGYVIYGNAQNNFGTTVNTGNSTTVTPTTLPQVLTIGTATASTSVNEVTVTWTNGNNGGKTLSAITITPYLNGTTAETPRTAATISSTSYTFTAGQLTAGSSYTFKVSATNANGTSALSSASNSVIMPNFLSVDFLVVAGGGGGGAPSTSQGGGGGGAGGLRSSVTATGGGGALESALPITKNTNITVTVGAGGAGGSGVDQYGSSGSNSVFSTVTSTGGGYGAYTDRNGGTGGSGGGSGSGGIPSSGGSGTANQGYSGGSNSGNPYHASGGGGAGAAGGNGGSGTGAGGNGVAVSITGSSVTYAGGGGGGPHVNNQTTGAGGSGGGGSSGAYPTNNGANGTANLGGGGGGGAGQTVTGGAGGSGVVILRWPTSAGTINVGAGLTSDATGTNGSYSYKKFTAGTGTVSWS